MKEKDIEDVFLSFTNGDIQCLISTNIIESGIDIKNANTLIIFNSNLFGLSQLYQLRGRVGRSNRRAYAYLFHDNEKLINKTALKKLQVLANYENLGSNFQLANEDLEIRGAGNLLGDEQSGHVKEIGIELYQSMLREEVERLKTNSTEEEEIFEDFEFNAHFEYYIPKKYISDDVSRLIIYRKLTNAKTVRELKDVLYEMEDRYGSYPHEVSNLINLLTIKIQSISIGIMKINLQKTFIDLVFHKVSEKLSVLLLEMVQQKFIKMKSPTVIQINNVEKDDLFYSIKLFYKKLEF
jgi:transcription-repair coupling factor (superfamily II helicase)